MRLHMKQFARLSNAHSKKLESQCDIVSLYTVFYDCTGISSAVKGRVSATLLNMSDVVR